MKWHRRSFVGIPVLADIVTVDATIELSGDLDIRGKSYVPAAGFTDPMFDGTGANWTLYSSTGTGRVYGNNRTNIGISMSHTSNAWECYGITFIGCAYVQAGGGNRYTQTGGGGIMRNCVFDNSPLRHFGVGTIVHDCIMKNCVRVNATDNGIAHWIGGPPYTSDHTTSGDGLQVYSNTYQDNLLNAAATIDSGVLYAGRCMQQGVTIHDCTFTRNNGKCIYLDDMASNVTVYNTTCTNNYGRALWVGGGFNNTITLLDDNSALYSQWDDRGNKTDPLSGNYHAQFHAGAWSHGAYSGDAASSPRLYNEWQTMLLAGKEAWRALYANVEAIFADEANYATEGTLILTRTGTSPAPQNGLGSTTLPGGVGGSQE